MNKPRITVKPFGYRGWVVMNKDKGIKVPLSGITLDKAENTLNLLINKVLPGSRSRRVQDCIRLS